VENKRYVDVMKTLKFRRKVYLVHNELLQWLLPIAIW